MFFKAGDDDASKAAPLLDSFQKRRIGLRAAHAGGLGPHSRHIGRDVRRGVGIAGGDDRASIADILQSHQIQRRPRRAGKNILHLVEPSSRC